MFGKITKFHGSGLIEAEIITSELPDIMPTTSLGIDNLGGGYNLAPGSTLYVTGTDKKYMLGTDSEWDEMSSGGGGGGSAVQSDWTQTDDTADDYIKHKPNLGTAAAKDSTNAVTQNSADLVESGAVYTAVNGKADKVSSSTENDLAKLDNNGNLVDSGILAGNVVTTSQTAGLLKNDGTIDTTAYTANTVIDTTCTLTAASWVGASAPYTQTANVTGILATDKPILDVSVSSTVATGIAEIADFAKISKAETGAGTITFSCYEEKPTNDLTVNIKVVR